MKLQEAEKQIVIDYEVYAQRPNDSDLLMSAIEVHAAKLRLVAAGRRILLSQERGGGESRRRQAGLYHNRGSKNVARKWRAGCEGRISVSNPAVSVSRRRWNDALGRPRGHRR